MTILEELESKLSSSIKGCILVLGPWELEGFPRLLLDECGLATRSIGGIANSKASILGCFRPSRTLSQSSIFAISSKALSWVLISFNSCDVRGLPTF